MINSKTQLQRKLEELLKVKHFYRDKLRQNNMVIPYLFVNTSAISECDEERIYKIVSERMCKKSESMLYEYEVNDKPVKKQIRDIVYALSEKVKYKASYEGVVAIKLTREFIAERENALLLQFLKEQGWYLIFSARENVTEIFDWISTKLFVDEIITVSTNDLCYMSLMDSLKQYEINLNDKLATELNGYMANIRAKETYDGRSEAVVVNALAYNAMKFAVRAQGDKSCKIRGVNELTEGINERAMSSEQKVKMGFCVEEMKGER